MKKSLQEILDSQDELATAFEAMDEPEFVAAAPYRRLLEARRGRVSAEAETAAAVLAARDAGLSWAAIGRGLGVSAQAAQKRYSRLAHA